MKQLPQNQTRPLARSFNMERLKAAKMFCEPLPDHLVMPISLVTTEKKLSESTIREFVQARQIIKKVLASGELNPTRFGLTTKIEHDILIAVNSASLLRHRLPQNWFYKSIYLQASFHDWKRINSFVPHYATSTAQMLYDIYFKQTDDLDPERHRPFQATFRQVEELNLAIGRVYESGIGIWNRGLVDYHTAVLVMSRAAWMGRNARQEYDEFKNAGGVYFLEYPQLRP